MSDIFELFGGPPQGSASTPPVQRSWEEEVVMDVIPYQKAPEAAQEAPGGDVAVVLPRSLDVALLRMLGTADGYDQWKPLIPAGALSRTSSVIVQDLGEWYNKTGDTRIDLDAFRSWLWLRHPSWSEELRDRLGEELNQLAAVSSPGVERLLRQSLAEGELKKRLQNCLQATGSELVFGLRDELDAAEMNLQLGDEGQDGEVTKSLTDILTEEMDGSGYAWPLECLVKAMRPLRAGDFGIIAARPDAGKSSFISFLLCKMLLQMPDGSVILWMNNEGLGERLKSRVAQATLGMAAEELVALGPGEAEARIAAVWGKRSIKILDVHGKSMADLEEIVRRRKPAVVVFDMLDKVVATGVHEMARTDQILEITYERARNMAVRERIPVFATSQVSAAGEGMKFPTQDMLKDSKTGKQGNADFILMLGKANEAATFSKRWISLTKNKLNRLGGKKDPMQEIVFDEPRCMFQEASSQVTVPIVGRNGGDAWYNDNGDGP